MIITVVCDVLGEENNGTTVAAMNLIKFLQQKGHTVRILCADQARKNQENVFVVPNYNFGKILNDYVHKVGVTLAKPDEEIVRNAIDGADIVHIMMPLSLGIYKTVAFVPNRQQRFFLRVYSRKGRELI